MHLVEWQPNDFNLFGPRKRMKLFQLMLITYDPKKSKNHAIPTLLCLLGLVNMEKVKTNKKSTLPKSPRVKTFFQLVPFLWHSHQSIMLKLGESWLGIQSVNNGIPQKEDRIDLFWGWKEHLLKPHISYSRENWICFLWLGLVWHFIPIFVFMAIFFLISYSTTYLLGQASFLEKKIKMRGLEYMSDQNGLS